MDEIWKLMDQHNVDVVLNGHDHDYQRFQPLDGNGNPSSDGMTEIVVGSAGHGHQSAIKTDPRLLAADFTDFGVVRMEFNASGLAYRFVTTQDATVDSGSVQCRSLASDFCTRSSAFLRVSCDRCRSIAIRTMCPAASINSKSSLFGIRASE